MCNMLSSNKLTEVSKSTMLFRSETICLILGLLRVDLLDMANLRSTKKNAAE